MGPLEAFSALGQIAAVTLVVTTCIAFVCRHMRWAPVTINIVNHHYHRARDDQQRPLSSFTD